MPIQAIMRVSAVEPVNSVTRVQSVSYDKVVGRTPAVKPNPSTVNPKATTQQLKNDGYTQSEIKRMKRAGSIECQTCSSRTYVDGSGDPGVSYKTPTKLSPGEAATAVFSHEREHVSRNAAKASREDKQVTQSSVRLFQSVCPECGNSYVSGGETRTQTKKRKENDHFKNEAFEQKLGKYFGKYIDETV